MKELLKDALRRIRDHRTRSIIVCAAVLLTAVLYSAVFGIASSSLSAYERMLQVLTGDDYHGAISYASYTEPEDMILARLRRLSYVKEAAALTPVGMGTAAETEEGLLSSSLRIGGFSDGDMTSHFFLTLTEGKFPEKADEVMLSRRHFPDEAVGGRVTLWLMRKTDSGAEPYAREFTVTGFYEAEKGAGSSELAAVVNGRENRAASPADGMMLYLLFHNRLNIKGKLEKALDSVRDAIRGEFPEPIVSAAYLTGNFQEQLNPASVFALLFSLVVIFGAASLLIVGVYSAALTQDMKMQGLLWVLGTTERQRKRAIWAEAGLLLLFSLPVGLLLGYLVGWRMLVPLMDSFGTDRVTGRFDGWVAVLAAVFTAATVLFSAVRPLRRIRKLTPVEAVRGEEKRGKEDRKWIRSRRTPGTAGLVRREIVRNPRAHIVPAVSVSLAALLIALTSSAVAVMRKNIASDLRTTDYQLCPTLGYSSISIDSGVGLTEEFCEAVKRLDGAEKTYPVRVAVDHVSATKEQKAVASAELDYWHGTGFNNEYFDVMFRELIAAADGTLTCCVLGIPRELFGAVPLKNGTIPTADAIPEGDFVIAAGMYREDASGDYFRDGDTVTLGGQTFSVVASEGWSYDVTRWISLHLYQYEDGCQLMILPLDVFETLYPDGTVNTLLVNEPEGGIGLLKESLTDLCASWGEAAFIDTADSADGTEGLMVDIDSRFDDLEEIRGQIDSLSAVGYSLAGLLFLIGALGIVNAALASAANRQREYALLEAVGMTGRQLGTMNFCENAFSVFVSAAVLAVSLPLMTRLLSAGFDADVKVDPVPALIMLGVQLTLSVIVSAVVFRMNRRRTLSERVRMEE